MVLADESAACRPDLQGACFDGSLELFREFAVTIDVDAALPPLSAIVSKMLPYDALRMACCHCPESHQVTLWPVAASDWGFSRHARAEIGMAGQDQSGSTVMR